MMQPFVVYLIRSMSPSSTRILVRMCLMFFCKRDENTSTYSQPMEPPMTCWRGKS